MSKKYFIAILIAVSALILIVGGLAYYKYSQIQTAISENANFQLPPEQPELVEQQSELARSPVSN
ncbi:MAG: hypothetical protein SH807_03425 [Blastochloris sp.]|nr:hypothetical protein [Blastochloris sp.]